MKRRSVSDPAFPSVVVALALSGLVLALVGAASGCHSSRLERVDGFRENVDMPDIPIPPEFKRDKGISFEPYAGRAGDFRSWKGIYIGLGKPASLADWYVEQMPLRGWVLKSSFAGQRRQLIYTKGNDEVATLKIYQHYFQDEDRYKTIVEADIRPPSPDELQPEDVRPDLAAGTASTAASIDTAKDEEISTPSQFRPEDEPEPKTSALGDPEH
jgi:hypothetical protein